MTYFAGLGSGTGWHKFAFIITPEELKQVFEDINYCFIETSSRVEDTYSHTTNKVIFDAYTVFFEKILLGSKEMSGKESWGVERKIRTSIIDDITKVEFEDLPNDESEEGIAAFKRACPQEPVINLSPFYLYLKTNGQLSTSIFNVKGIIGL